ncbi:hypothetical protein Prudu_353S000100, partial [Prunus dulcis]
PRFLHNGNRPCKKRFDALHMQGTWSLVHIAGNKNIVGSKWIYKIKRNSYGSIARHKARQEQGLDFSETFSPVVRHTTIRLILSLAAMNKWHLRQLDVKNAFLHGELEEEVFETATRVCRSRHSDSEVVILLLYSDDIILIGSNEKMVHLVIDELSSVFEMKDLGKLKFFLGASILCLQCPNMLKVAPQSWDDLLSILFNSMSIVGALQYLTFTRPDLAYSVNSVCQ